MYHNKIQNPDNIKKVLNPEGSVDIDSEINEALKLLGIPETGGLSPSQLRVGQRLRAQEEMKLDKKQQLPLKLTKNDEIIITDSLNEVLYDLVQDYANKNVRAIGPYPEGIRLPDGNAYHPDRVLVYETGGISVIEVKPWVRLVDGSPWKWENNVLVFKEEPNKKMSLAQKIVSATEYLGKNNIPFWVVTEDLIEDMYKNANQAGNLLPKLTDGENVIPVFTQAGNLSFDYIEALLRHHFQITKHENIDATMKFLNDETKNGYNLKKKLQNFNTHANRARKALSEKEPNLQKVITQSRHYQTGILQQHVQPMLGGVAGFVVGGMKDPINYEPLESDFLEYGDTLPKDVTGLQPFSATFGKDQFERSGNAFIGMVFGGLTGKGARRLRWGMNDFVKLLAGRASEIAKRPEVKSIASSARLVERKKAETVGEYIQRTETQRVKDAESVIKEPQVIPSIPEELPPVNDIQVGSLVTDTSTDTPRLGRVKEIRDDVYSVQIDNPKTPGGRGTIIESKIENLKYEGDNQAKETLEAHLGIQNRGIHFEPENDVQKAVNKVGIKHIKTNLVDEAASVEAFEKAIEKEVGRSLLPKERVYAIRRFFPAAASAEAQRLHRIFEPVRELNGNEERMLNVLLSAQRNDDIGIALAGKEGVEKYTRMLKPGQIQKLLNKDALFPGGRVPINELLQQMETKIGRDGVEKIVAAAKNIKKEWRTFQQELVNEGLLSQREMDIFQSKFRNFIQVNISLDIDNMDDLEKILDGGKLLKLDEAEKLKSVVAGKGAAEFQDWLVDNPGKSYEAFRKSLLQDIANQVNQDLPLLTHINTRLALAELIKRNRIKQQLFKMSHLTDEGGKVVETGIRSYKQHPRTKKWHRLMTEPGFL